MNFRCEDCGTTSEIKVNDFCPRCGSEKFNEIKPEERIYLKSVASANTLMSFGNTFAVLMIIAGSIITLAGLLNFILLIIGVAMILSSILMMFYIKNQGLILINLAELNKKKK